MASPRHFAPLRATALVPTRAERHFAEESIEFPQPYGLTAYKRNRTVQKLVIVPWRGAGLRVKA